MSQNMTQEEMTNLIDKQLNAYNAHDIDQFCSCFHPEIKVYLLISNELRASGLSIFRENYKKLFETSPHLKCEIIKRIVLSSSIIDEELVHGSSRHENGQLHSTAIYAFRDQLIDRVWFVR